MKIRLGIQLKVSLLVLGLSLTLALLIPYLLIDDTQAIVENHEITDLSDETSLRAWEIVSIVSDLGKDLAYCSKLPMDAFRVNAPEGGSSTAGEVCAKLAGKAESPNFEPFRYAKRYRSIELVAPDGTAEVLFASLDPTASIERASLITLALTAEKGVPLLSKIERFATSPTSHDAIVWGALPLPTSGYNFVVSVSVAPNLSPRHLSFIVDENGNSLLDPVPGSPKKFSDSTIFKKSPTDTTFSEGQNEILRAAESARQDARRESLSPLLRFPVQERQPLGKPYFYLQGTPDGFKENVEAWKDNLDLQLRFEEQIRMIAQDYVAEGKRFGGLTQAVSTVRLLSSSKEELEELREDIENRIREKFPPELQPAFDRVRWDWHQIVPCENADVCTVIIPLASATREHVYRFVHATFREELSAGVSRELNDVRDLGIIISFAMGTLAFVLTSFIVRPLKKITATANQVHGTEGGELHNKIEAVRKALPIGRSDEVGGIARALEHLLLEVLNGHNQLRQAKADTDREVIERTKELQEANAQLKGLAEAKDAFLASVSHELRQPLNSMFGFIQFLEFSELDEEQSRDLAKIRTAASYLKGLISDILDYQKIIMGGLEIEVEEIDTNLFLGEIRDGMAIQAADNKNELNLVCQEDIPDITNDRQRLKQILVNLLSNACKFTKGGRITLTATLQKGPGGRDDICFAVADTGRGMKPEEQQNMFVRFKKLASKEGNRSGTGLGLVISKGLAEMMGGDITFSSEFGKGTTFTVTVPVHVSSDKEAPEEQPGTIAEDPAGNTLTHAVASGARRVLVIDDDPNVREMMTRHLTGKGFEVVEASDGEGAVDIASKCRPDVITLDAVMPNKDGWSVLEELKAAPETNHIPVIMVTFLEEENRGVALGASDYIIKPVDWSQLTKALSKYTSAGKIEHEVLLIEDDADTRELYRRTLEGGGWKVIEATNGEEGINVLKKEIPACILLDLMMPVLDGFGFIEEFNRHPEWQMIPIIVVSAKSSTAEDRRRLNGSVEAILQKGGGQEDLLGQLISHVNRLSLKSPNQE